MLSIYCIVLCEMKYLYLSSGERLSTLSNIFCFIWSRNDFFGSFVSLPTRSFEPNERPSILTDFSTDFHEKTNDKEWLFWGGSEWVRGWVSYVAYYGASSMRELRKSLDAAIQMESSISIDLKDSAALPRKKREIKKAKAEGAASYIPGDKQ